MPESEEKFKPMDLKEEYTKSNVTYKKLGEEACGGLTCYKYEEKQGSGDQSTRTFWFDTKELLLRKETNGYGEFKSTEEYSYDNLSVSAPSPTKEVPEGKSIYDYMVAGMMGEDAANQMEEAKKMMPKQEEVEKMMQQYQKDYTPTDEYAPDDTPEPDSY